MNSPLNTGDCISVAGFTAPVVGVVTGIFGTTVFFRPDRPDAYASTGWAPVAQCSRTKGRHAVAYWREKGARP